MLLDRDVTLSRSRTNGDLLRRDLIALGFNSWEFLGFDKFEKIFFHIFESYGYTDYVSLKASRLK